MIAPCVWPRRAYFMESTLVNRSMGMILQIRIRIRGVFGPLYVIKTLLPGGGCIYFVMFRPPALPPSPLPSPHPPFHHDI